MSSGTFFFAAVPLGVPKKMPCAVRVASRVTILPLTLRHKAKHGAVKNNVATLFFMGVVIAWSGGDTTPLQASCNLHDTSHLSDRNYFSILVCTAQIFFCGRK